MLKVRKYNSQLLVFVISKQVIVPLNTLIFVKFHTVFDFQNIAGRKGKYLLRKVWKRAQLNYYNSLL